MAAVVLVLMLHALSLALVSSVPGGIYDITMNTTSEEVQAAVQRINDVFAGVGDSAPRTVVEVVRARQQVGKATGTSFSYNSVYQSYRFYLI